MASLEISPRILELLADLVRQVAVVVDLQPRSREPFEQAGRAQRRGRQVLAGRVASRAARDTHH